MKNENTIGFGIERPEKTVEPDKNCPFYGSLKVRGNIFRGTVVKASAQLTATVQVDRMIYIPKYKRYQKKIAKIQVHNPAVINARVGDVVDCIGCRPISKMKSSVIVRVEK